MAGQAVSEGIATQARQFISEAKRAAQNKAMSLDMDLPHRAFTGRSSIGLSFNLSASSMVCDVDSPETLKSKLIEEVEGIRVRLEEFKQAIELM